MNEIQIIGLETWGHVGVFQFEKDNGQKFIFDIILETNSEKACVSDDLNDTINYAEVVELINKVMGTADFDLIEHLAHYVASQILITFPICCGVDITVKKPDAPITTPFKTMAFRENLKWYIFAFSLGSNMGDMQNYLLKAISTIEQTFGIRSVKSSKMITTKPYGKIDQPDFLNMAIIGETFLTPRQLLDLCHEIEQDANRVRTEHWGPRTLDIDVVFYGDKVIDEPDFCVPHVDMQNRLFVLEPLAEIAPYFVHPLLKERVIDLYNKLIKN